MGNQKGTAKKTVVIAVAAAAAAAAVIFFFFNKQISSSVKRNRLKGLNIVLITLDTQRADYLSCYNRLHVRTPNLDVMAAEGVKFNRCISQTPLTLPAHTTILSGTYPFYHKVRDNGGFIVPDQLELISEILKKKDYRTAGFIAAYVLHSKWGLNQGFDHYSESFDQSKSSRLSLSELQRRADAVLGDAGDWISANRDQKFFCWIHLYDPHTPYDPPPPFNGGDLEGRPYAGEVAYMDHQLGIFFERLKKEKIDKKTMYVIVGDHGESLGEHKENTHGFFIYHSSVWVPFIIKAPFRFPVHTVDRYVEHTDIVPTILDTLDTPVPREVQGKSLLPLMFGDAIDKQDMAYTETYYPRQHFSWSELKGLYRDKWKFIQAPKKELYNIVSDSAEKENLTGDFNKESRDLESLMYKFVIDRSKTTLSPGAADLDAETKQRLASLGYLSATGDTSDKKELPDPKDKIEIFEKFALTRRLGDANKHQEAVDLLKAILAEDPEITDAYMRLGNNYFRLNRYDDALIQFRKVLERKPDYNFAMLNVLNTLTNMGKIDEAQSECRRFLKIFPDDTNLLTKLGELHFIKENYDDAHRVLTQAVKLDGENAKALNKLGEIYLYRKDKKKANEYFSKVRSLNPGLKRLNFNLALQAESDGDIDGAVAYYLKELESNPRHLKSNYNLAEIYRQRSEWDSAIEYYQKCIEFHPNFNIPYFMTAKIYFDTGRNTDQSIRLCQEGVQIKPVDKYTAFGYFILADIFAPRDKRKADGYLKKAEQIMRDLP